MAQVVTHEEFIQAVANHLKEREGSPIIVIVHSRAGLEMLTNFLDFVLQSGMLRIASLNTSIAFEQQTREGLKSGDNQIMVSNIQDALDPNKKKVN